ncbi:MAG: Asp-tRNA(Asn)/Glu-tRNA(Gln) amidotransferase subunit GatB [Myxococcota bacterium]|nr:Asp-tRNA(Asn)/Glu-tRNA(Gln) amidotransferase subunit GatB [Myxococcota bacterium]
MSRDGYEVVIGLEVHTHLATESKLFSPAPVRYGDPPNHDVSPVDLALPGVLPVLNEQVIDLAIRFGLAIHGEVNRRSIFARKNYFYPDLPKGYQISQFEEPVIIGGYVEINPGDDGSRRIGLTRAHLEEDAGKSIHDAAVAGADDSLIDLNRAGVPLLEIVSEPDLRSSEEAGAYLRALRSILRYIGVSHGDMEKGQFRCDANVSLRPRGEEQLGTRTETKNVNSFSNVEAAIDAEVERQAEILDDGGDVVQATMAFDPVTRRTRVLRLKENSDDYRYFPDPDLVPLVISEAQIEQVRASLPELPAERRARFQEDHGLAEGDAAILTASRGLADFYEEAVGATSQSATTVAKWVLRDLLRALKIRECEIEDAKVTPAALAALIDLVEAGRLTVKSAQELVAELVAEGGDPVALMSERGLEAVSDAGLIGSAVDEAIDAHPEVVSNFQEGDQKAINFLMGRVMQKTQGKANPGRVRELLLEKLS